VCEFGQEDIHVWVRVKMLDENSYTLLEISISKIPLCIVFFSCTCGLFLAMVNPVSVPFYWFDRRVTNAIL
jgi:hypothetical protein